MLCPPYQTTPACLLEWRKIDQTHIMLGARGYSLFDPRRFTQDVLSVLLGGMMSSRLFVEVREKLGLAYFVSTSSVEDPDTGFLVTQAGIQNENVEKAVATIMREYRKVARSLVSVEELKKAKENMKGRMALSLESSNEQAVFYGLQEILEARLLPPEKIYDKIDAVSRKDVKAVAQDIFSGSKLNLALLGPYRNKAKLHSLLRI